jgi:anti-sigma factor RsiW
VRDLAQRASAAYSVYAMDAAHPVEIAAADADRLAAWLSKRMNMAFPIPKLDDRGFELVGGRLMIGETAPAGLLMYQNAQGRRIILYVRNDLPADHPTKMHYQHSNAGGTVYWRGETTGFGLAGALSEQEMVPIANLIRAKF